MPWRRGVECAVHIERFHTPSWKEVQPKHVVTTRKRPIPACWKWASVTTCTGKRRKKLNLPCLHRLSVWYQLQANNPPSWNSLWRRDENEYVPQSKHGRNGKGLPARGGYRCWVQQLPEVWGKMLRFSVGCWIWKTRCPNTYNVLPLGSCLLRCSASELQIVFPPKLLQAAEATPASILVSAIFGNRSVASLRSSQWSCSLLYQLHAALLFPSLWVLVCLYLCIYNSSGSEHSRKQPWWSSHRVWA